MSSERLSKLGVLLIKNFGDEAVEKRTLGSKVLVSSESTGGRYSIVEQVLPEGKVSERHKHTLEGHSVEILSGALEVLIESEHMLLKEGSYVYIPENIWHEFRVLQEKTTVRIVIMPGGFERLFVELPNCKPEDLPKLNSKFGIHTGKNVL
ncbi:MAG: cupin domain-containing protein [Rhodobacteraceae bacterium]|nr:cupin domain-containing protein [Paracoccaceae bacterium]